MRRPERSRKFPRHRKSLVFAVLKYGAEKYKNGVYAVTLDSITTGLHRKSEAVWWPAYV
eukprot:m.23113 g.23113  ORF g.23113 m.23113 type:complete len:59 (+) comp28441_c0_seq2:1169-1345(+)